MQEQHFFEPDSIFSCFIELDSIFSCCIKLDSIFSCSIQLDSISSCFIELYSILTQIQKKLKAADLACQLSPMCCNVLAVAGKELQQQERQ